MYINDQLYNIVVLMRYVQPKENYDMLPLVQQTVASHSGWVVISTAESTMVAGAQDAWLHRSVRIAVVRLRQSINCLKLGFQEKIEPYWAKKRVSAHRLWHVLEFTEFSLKRRSLAACDTNIYSVCWWISYIWALVWLEPKKNLSTPPSHEPRFG